MCMCMFMVDPCGFAVATMPPAKTAASGDDTRLRHANTCGTDAQSLKPATTARGRAPRLPGSADLQLATTACAHNGGQIAEVAASHQHRQIV